MKKILEKSLSFLLAIIIIFSSAIVGLNGIDFNGLFAVKAEAASVGYMTLTLSDDGKSYSVTDCLSSASGSLVIPSIYNGKPVTSIGQLAFSYCKSLTSIEIPDSITSIGFSAFVDCYNLTSITIPDSITSIGLRAFDGCTKLTSIYITDIEAWCNIVFSDIESNPLYESNYLSTRNLYLNGELVTELVIPESVTNINDYAFCQSSIISVTIHSDVKSIGASAFSYCYNLKSVTIADGATVIGRYAFYNCTNITSITIPDSITYVGGYAFDGTGYYNDKSNWEDGVLYLGKHLIKAETSLSGAYEIKPGTKTILAKAFYGCTNLTLIKIPDSLTSIDDDAFYGCTNLTSITIPDSVTNIGMWTFYNTGYYNDDINWEAGALYIGKHLIATSSIPEIYEVKEGTKTVAGGAFYGKSVIEYVTIPDTVVSVGECAFYNCENLKSVKLSEGLTSISDETFRGCKNLDAVTIPEGVISIGDRAFYDSKYFKSIALPSSLKSIGSQAFELCGYLSDVYISNLEAWCNIDFATQSSYPQHANAFDNKLYLNGNLVTNLVIPEGVTKLNDYAFYNIDYITSVTIPDTVTAIGNSAFERCFGLQYITIGNGVKSIGANAFSGCTGNFQAAYINDVAAWCNIEFENEYSTPMFWPSCKLYINGEAAENIVIPDGVTSIGNYAFYNVFVKCITIPESLTSIGDYAFDGTWLNTIYYCGLLDNWDNISIGIENDRLGYAIKRHLCTYDGEGIIDTAPTCTEEGSKIIACRVCGEEKTEAIPATGHNASDWITNPDSTCTEKGSKHKECTLCGAILETDVISAKGHTEVKDAAVAPTCTGTGYTEGSHCSVCNEVIVAQNIVPATGHSYGDWIINSNPACIETGSKSRVCSICSNIETAIIEANGHNYSSEWTIDVAPNCTEAGSKSHHCTVCGEKSDITVVSATGHSYGDWVVNSAPTCTGVGSKSRVCSTCSNIETATIEENGHSYSTEWTIDVAPTCTGAGSKSHHCIVCGDKADITVISATGHNYSDWVVDKAATCDETGLKHKICSVCGEVVTETIAANGHGYSTEWTIDVAPTCTVAGSKSHHCTACDNKTDVTLIEATGHTESDWIVESTPTCYNSGLKYKCCTVCCCRLETEELAPLGHTLEWKVNTPATCLNWGVEIAICTVCGEFCGGRDIPPTYHVEGDWIVVIGETCADESYRYTQCKDCPAIIKRETITGKEHNYSATWTIDKEPTCDEAGSKSHHCTVCGNKADVTVIEATGHTISDWIVDKPSTCIEEGSKHKECTVCGCELLVDTIFVLPHITYWETVKEATCLENGQRIKKCKTCENQMEVETINAKEHTASDWKTDKKATVNAAGKKVQKCTECGKTLKTSKIAQLKCSKPKLSKVENTADGVKITWGKVSGADKYYVYRKAGSNGKYSRIGSTSKTYYTDKKASSGKKYYYIVKAINEAGASSSSSSLSKYYLADPTLKTPSSTKKGIVLKWNKITGADGYMVYRKTGSGSYSKIATVKGNSKVTYTDKKASKGKTYTYKIKAYKSKTYSAYSNAKKIKDKY